MPDKLIPFGYSTPGAEQRLAALMASDPEMWLVDIRLKAWSHTEQWRGDALKAAWPGRYVPLPQLGNVNYNQHDAPIALADERGGMMRLENILKHRSVVLLCACKDYATCHRKHVVELVRAVMPDVEVLLEDVPPPEDETALRARNIPSIPPPEFDNACELTQAIAKAEAAKARPKVPVDYWTAENMDADAKDKVRSALKSKY